MAKRVALIALLLFGLGLAAGAALRARARSSTGQKSGPQGQVEVTVSSTDVPGCIAASAPFRAVVRSQWGDKWSENILAFTWVPAENGNSIVVSASGQTLRKALQPRQPFPKISLQLPLGTQAMTVPLTSFVFDRFDDAGRACFSWQEPPGTPRPVAPPATPLGRT